MLLSDNPLAMSVIVLGFGWVLELAAVLLLITVIALFCTNVKKEEEMTAEWN